MTARVVGRFDEMQALAEFRSVGMFAFGLDANGSRAYRFMVDAPDEAAAFDVVVTALLRVEGIVPHDVYSGSQPVA